MSGASVDPGIEHEERARYLGPRELDKAETHPLSLIIHLTVRMGLSVPQFGTVGIVVDTAQAISYWRGGWVGSAAAIQSVRVAPLRLC